MSIDAFLQIIERLPEATLLLTKDGVVVGVNRRMVRLGLDPKAIQGKSLLDFAAGQTDAFIDYLHRCGRTSDPIPGTLLLSGGDGNELACRTDGSLLRPPSEELEAIIMLRLVRKDVSVGQFVTLNQKIEALGKEVARRAKVQEELQEQKERLAVTLASIGDAVIVTDTQTRVTFLNSVAESLTGWPLADAIGTPLAEVFNIINEDSRQVVESPVTKVIREGGIVGLANHTLLIARDGTERPIDDSGAPIRTKDGTIVGVVLVFRDITESKQADAQLRRSEEKFRTLADSISQLAWMARPDGHIFWYNSRWYDYTGTTPEEMEGWGWQSVHDPLELQTVIPKWKACVESGEPFEMVFPLRGADGVFRHFLTRVMPTRDKEGRLILWCGTNTDVTEHRRMEEQLRENDKRKDEFLAMLAHELRNPLAAVNNAVRVLKMSEDDENRHWASDTVERQVKQLVRLIDDLLDVSRITSGKIRLRRDYTDASTILDQAVETVRPLMEERKHELLMSVDRGNLPLWADATRVEQIVVNLLTNAAKYTESGGRIWLTAVNEGDAAVITVRDTGIGIPPEKLPGMFKLFAQGERSIARSEGGLGIGLTVVQKLTEMHNGSVSASSKGFGEGSEFTVRLPIARRTNATASGPLQGPNAARERSRILVVDDNVDTASGMARLLKLLGNETALAHDGPSAIEAVQRFKPDFILLDIGLPGMDGFEVAKAIRQRADLRDAVIIGVSGYGQEDDRRRSREAGFNHHLVKPVDFDKLVSLLTNGTVP